MATPEKTPSDIPEFFIALFAGRTDPFDRPLYQAEDHGAIAQKWRETFSARLHSETGNWTHRGYDWHVFGYEYASALTGKAAEASYQQLKDQRAFVFTHAKAPHPLCGRTPLLPTIESLRNALRLFPRYADVYVTASDFRWTFVATHEDSSGIGPFFAAAESL